MYNKLYRRHHLVARWNVNYVKRLGCVHELPSTCCACAGVDDKKQSPHCDINMIFLVTLTLIQS